MPAARVRTDWRFPIEILKGAARIGTRIAVRQATRGLLLRKGAAIGCRIGSGPGAEGSGVMLRTAILSVSLSLVPMFAPAQSYCSDTMAGWTSQMFASVNAGFAASIVTTDGHLAPPCLQFTHNAAGVIRVAHLPPYPSGQVSLPHCPDTVPIQLACWVKVLNGAGFGNAIAFQWVAVQAGVIYVSNSPGFLSQTGDSTWHAFANAGGNAITLAAFTDPTGVVAGHPSFAAGPIQFGVASANSCGCAFYQQATGRIDEFCIAIQMPSTITSGGPGCVGSLGVPSNSAGLAQIGLPFSDTVGNLPFDIGVLLIGLSDTVSTLGPLPYDMTLFGAPGCFLRVSLDAQFALVGTGGSATVQMPIPGMPALLCLHLYTQGASLDPAANAMGWVMSNAMEVTIGN